MKLRARIFTLGHSNRKASEVIEILQSYKLKLVVDVRTIPRSRHNPQFNAESLMQTLKQHGIEYIHMPGLGGLRHTQANSINKAWRNNSFRGYADYMQTEEFTENLQRLISRSKRKRLVIMCAEALPWRCHRSLISDALSLWGITAEDIFSKTSHHPHRRTPFAHVHGKKITYPAKAPKKKASSSRHNLDAGIFHCWQPLASVFPCCLVSTLTISNLYSALTWSNSYPFLEADKVILLRNG